MYIIYMYMCTLYTCTCVHYVHVHYYILTFRYAMIHIPIIASVSEHQPTTWTSFFFDLHVLVCMFPAGVWFVMRHLTDVRVFGMSTCTCIMYLYMYDHMLFAQSFYRVHLYVFFWFSSIHPFFH